MRSVKFILITLLITSLLFQCSSAKQKKINELPAFPGAEGFGSKTHGGRGGRVLFVTSLRDNGPGSLRAACESPGPRIIVFRTGGTIILRKPIRIVNPFLTIAGQTAPGDGITLRGAGFIIKTHDVIIRNLRIRIGDDRMGPKPETRDGFTISNRMEPPYNIIIDHCSVSWAIDENFDIFKNAHDITFQWCISSEGLRNSLHPEGQHSAGMKVGPDVQRISIHHNLFAHNYRRNPKIGRDARSFVEVINNVVYNWKNRATDILGNANIINNIYKVGPNWNGRIKGIHVKNIKNIRVFVGDNIGPGRENNEGDPWNAVSGGAGKRVKEPAFPLSDINITPIRKVLEKVLNCAGAVAPRRDAIDMRIVQSVKSKTGRIIDSQNEVGGWIKVEAGKPLRDTDGDGIPDQWEIQHNLNPNSARDAKEDANHNGYPDIEDYLNSLIPNCN